MKPTFYISCPIDTYSGYGARARDFVKALIQSDKYTVKILPQRWGETRWGFLNDHSEEWGFMNNHLHEGQLTSQPDIWAQVTVPNEFQPVGKYNIGVTAGIETNLCDASWIEGLNRMDLNLVPSEHSKNVFEKTEYEKRSREGNQFLGKLKTEKPIEVLFEGVDLSTYKVLSKSEVSLDLSEVKESFAFLFVGHWMNGELGEDRKNVGLLVKSFYETFKNSPQKPALILKTCSVNSSYLDKKRILDRIHAIKDSINSDSLPPVYVLHGDFSNEEINELYNHPKVKCFVSLTKGEGFGRPLLEFTQCKKPIITTNWSGHVDFLNPKYTTLIDGELTQVHPSATSKNIILEESSWFTPNLMEIGISLQDVFNNYKSYTEKAKLQGAYSKNRFSLEKMDEKLVEILDANLPNFPETLELKLPELAAL